jgi:hypothetical protein
MENKMNQRIIAKIGTICAKIETLQAYVAPGDVHDYLAEAKTAAIKALQAASTKD